MAEVDTSRLVVDYRKKLLLRKELESRNRNCESPALQFS